MKPSDNGQESAIELALSLCHSLGMTAQQNAIDTPLAGVRLFRYRQYQKSTPTLYSQGIAVIFSGRKVGRVNEHELAYCPDRCLIVATPYPMECETFATDESPLVGLYIRLDLAVIKSIVSSVEQHRGSDHFHREQPSCGLETAAMTPAINRCMHKLLGVLHDPLDSEILGPALLREFYYLLLLGGDGGLLAQCCHKDTTFGRLNRVVEYVQSHYDQKIVIDELAAMAGMSTSAFHRAFKNTITDPPLQYIKKVRLNQAKNLLLAEKLPANVAATRVGYESAPQFSREFKRYFGLPPSRVAELA